MDWVGAWELGMARTRQIRDITGEPDQEEFHRQGVGALGLVVGDELGELYTQLAMMY